jgi:hypothetical protein
MTEPFVAPAKRREAPWRGRRRVPDPKKVLISFRCTTADHEAIDRAAGRAGLSIGAYLRTLALGNAGARAVRRPTVEHTELARILGHLGKVGSNINQLAHGYNRSGRIPGYAEMLAVSEDVGEMRAALLKALGRDHKG